MKLDTLPGAGRQGGWERHSKGGREERKREGGGKERDSFMDRGNKHLVSSKKKKKIIVIIKARCVAQ